MTVFLCVIFAISVIYHPATSLAVNDEHDCDPNADIVSSDFIDETAPPEEEIPCVPISEIDLDDDLAFLADYGVSIPKTYLDRDDLNGLIHEIVDYVRKNNYHLPISNVQQIAFFYAQIESATAAYDGVDIEALRSESGEPTRYTLTGSTKYGIWKNYYAGTNCYGYALGRKIFENIGHFSKSLSYVELVNLIKAGNVGEIAKAFKKDLEQLGYSVIKTTTAPSSATLSNSNNVVICLRIHKGNPESLTNPGDFHFMRYNQTAKGWVHKPGPTQVLKFRYQSVDTNTWSDEHIDSKGVAFAPSIYYTSDIYYFICTPHSHRMEEVNTGDTSAHHCLCMLCGKTYYEAHVLNSSGSVCIVCGRKPPFTKSRFIGGVGCEIALPQTNHEAFMRKLYPDNNDQ